MAIFLLLLDWWMLFIHWIAVAILDHSSANVLINVDCTNVPMSYDALFHNGKTFTGLVWIWKMASLVLSLTYWEVFS